MTDTGVAVYTIRYAAASSEHVLHVQWVETENDCSSDFSCDNAAVIYAVALSSSSGSATGATASLFGGRGGVGISGSHDAISRLAASRLRTGIDERRDAGAPINGLPINGLRSTGCRSTGLPINGLPINGLPINGLPINGLPINGLPINGLPINGLPINGLPINGLPINGLPRRRGSPAAGRSCSRAPSLAGKPLQTITLQQVLDAQPEAAAADRRTSRSATSTSPTARSAR